MESNKMKRTTSRDQFKCLVSKMKEHPDIAKNFTRNAPNEVEQFWEGVRDDLISLGSPSKTIAEWKKIWSDFIKSAVKKKLAHNNREMQATGGGENRQQPLTSLEEDVADLVGLNDRVGGIRNAKQFGVPQKKITENTTPINLELTVDDVTPSTSKRTREGSNLYTSRYAMDHEFLGNENGMLTPEEMLKVLPEFDGKKSVDVWLTQFENVCNAYTLSDNDKRILLLKKLKGKALQWMHSKPNFVTDSVDTLLDEMQDVLKSKDSKKLLRKSSKHENGKLESIC
ncbi:uncharacterized protein [Eurosta solidaginis]|uniref:uncharacterized protein n=1 Tax=Eurosta solidaginis TaxID=178769 RepID=UPI0035316698